MSRLKDRVKNVAFHAAGIAGAYRDAMEVTNPPLLRYRRASAISNKLKGWIGVMTAIASLAEALVNWLDANPDTTWGDEPPYDLWDIAGRELWIRLEGPGTLDQVIEGIIQYIAYHEPA